MIVITLAADRSPWGSVVLSTVLRKAEGSPCPHDASDREQRQGLLASSVMVLWRSSACCVSAVSACFSVHSHSRFPDGAYRCATYVQPLSVLRRHVSV